MARSRPAGRAIPDRAAAGPLPTAARALFGGSLALLALRALAAVLPGRWLWGLDVARDVAPWAALLGFALPLALHAPPLARGVARLVPAGARGQAALAAALAVVLALFMLAHPDRALFTGDASLRHGAFAAIEKPEQFAVQAMRGDLLLHHDLPQWAGTHTPWTADQAGRAQGALLALLAALAGWRLANALGARGEVAFAVMAIAACTGALALDNGYGKASVEVACLTGIAAVGVAHAARDGGGVGTVGASVALALLLHRSGLALLPAWLASAVFAVRSGTWRRPTAIAGMLAPVAALALVGRRLVNVIGSFDREHHFSGGLARTLGLAFSYGHLLDVVHTLCLLVPLAPLLPLLLLLPPRPPAREAWGFALLAVPPLTLLIGMSPQQGLSRDWDVFAFGGVALAAIAAWRVAAILGALPRALPGASPARSGAMAAPSGRWLAVPLAVVAACPALQFAALQSDAERMWSRAESIFLGPPMRDASERARGLSTMGMMRYGHGEYELALQLFERSAEAAPNPRTWVEMGMAQTMLGHPDAALAQYRHAASLNPDLVTAWRGVAAAASALGDRAAMAEAVRELERLEPGGDVLRDARAWLEANPAPASH